MYLNTEKLSNNKQSRKALHPLKTRSPITHVGSQRTSWFWRPALPGYQHHGWEAWTTQNGVVEKEERTPAMLSGRVNGLITCVTTSNRHVLITQDLLRPHHSMARLGVCAFGLSPLHNRCTQMSPT